MRRRLSATSRSATALMLICATTLLFQVVAPSSARAERTPVQLGAAASFALLAGTTITNTGLTEVTGNIGISPGTAITGFPPGQQFGGTFYPGATADAAKAALLTAYDDVAGRPDPDLIATEVGGTTVKTGVYKAASGTFGINGTVTLDAEGDPNAIFIFQTDSTLITGADAAVSLANGAQSCNVFWQVGSSATLGANNVLRGNILALTSVTVGAGVTVDGRVLALGGAVTMNTDTVVRSDCRTPGFLSITAPETASLGSARPGGEFTRALGPVVVTDERLLSEPTWVASVTATNFVTSGSPVQTVGNVNLSYWSGPSTTTTGIGIFVSGQPTALDAEILNAKRTVFTLSSGRGNNSATWNPTISLQLPLAAVAGLYTGTLTFSVA